ncbi:MAG: hypothetical protein C0507_08230 [Cyanobacteria bacterium PR.3.49]|nr:hypothetical protein [Cyanobacteria bacterium PR.3.49]
MNIKLVWIVRASAIVLCTAMIWWLLWVDFHRRDLVEATDFANSCYVAGKIATSGNVQLLYPEMSAKTYVGSSFPAIAHETLSTLPSGSYPVWQYSPLNAFLFSYLSNFSVDTALLIWQVLNGLATVAIAFMVAKPLRLRVLDAFLFCFCFAPWFMMIKFGQQGLIFGVLPLCLGFWFAGKNRSVLAGLCLSITFLNPKYLIIAGLFAAISFWRNKKILPGLILGVAFWIVFLYLAAPHMMLPWLHGLKLAELYFFDPHLLHRTFIYTSLPALSILNLPVEFREVAKIVCYSAAGVVGAATLWVGLRASKQLQRSKFYLLALSLSFLAMPVIEPHLLFYDLSGAAIGLLGIWQLSKSKMPNLGGVSAMLWVAITGYFLIFAFHLLQPQPMVFVLILSAAYLQILRFLLRELPNTGFPHQLTRRCHTKPEQLPSVGGLR